jgi:hypothetical protein
MGETKVMCQVVLRSCFQENCCKSKDGSGRIKKKRIYGIVAALMISFHHILKVYIYLCRSSDLTSLSMGGNVKTILIPCLQQQ